MNSSKSNISEKLNQYLAIQSRYSDSPFSQFVQTYSLAWILDQLQPNQKKMFLSLLKKKKFTDIPEFLEKNIPDFSVRLSEAIDMEIGKIKKQAVKQK